ncbi:hypothetical protein ABZ249_31370 [Nocardiopsis sp. NPDC006139]|uniref:hypothetical protein n=1 Tax=Nocardiopsis sp. NPDC006139 TaxID=3154578 RepID=UPI0033A86F68
MTRRDPSRAPSLWGDPTTTAEVPAEADGPAPAPTAKKKEKKEAPVPAAADRGAADQGEEGPVKVGPGIGERLGAWARASFTPPEIWSTDRPSLSKQLRYAREGLWGPAKGWHRTAAIVCFWAVSFPTSVAAYALEWIGERPSRWVVALVLISLAYQVPYIPEAVGFLVRIPAWPLTASWSALGLMSP